MHQLLEQLQVLNFPVSDHALFGSGPLLVRGWLDSVGDLDVLARGPAWERALELGSPEYLVEWDVTVVNIGGAITVGTRWSIGEVNADVLIDTAEVISGIPCVRLEHVVAYKRLADRAKDRDHLALIEQMMRSD